MKTNVKYKNFSFDILFDKGDNILSVVEMNNESDDVLISFRDDIFFDAFVGETIDADEKSQENFIRRVKKYLRTFLNELDEEAIPVEVVEFEEVKTDSQPTPTTTTSKSIEVEKPNGVIDKMIFEVVSSALGSEQSKDNIDKLIKQSMKENGVVPFRKILEIKPINANKKELGIQHKDFEKVMMSLSARVPLALVGPAGSGKTTIVYEASKALDLTFASQSVSAQSTVFDFFGYKDANGKYVPTLFREKYENGGVFLLDEFDAGNPNVLAALNQATANSVTSFPDKMIEKHKDFVIVMAGNTFGGGGTLDYVGRNKIDAATLDRFGFIYIDYDEDLERQLSTNEDWCNRVQYLRQRAYDKKIRTIISPRATFNGEKLLAAGIRQKQVEEMVIFKGMTTDERQLLNA